MTQVTTTGAQKRLPELLDAAEAGEIVIIEAGEGRVFRISSQPPAPAASPGWTDNPKPGSVRGMIQISEGFDEPLEELNEYVE